MDKARQLIDAAQQGNLSVVLELLDSDRVPVHACDQEGCTALHHAAANGHEAVVKALLVHGAAVDAVSRYGWTPLMQAAAFAHSAVVRMLLQHGANVNLTNEMGSTALLCAARTGNASVAHALLSNGALLEHSAWPISPLAVAAQQGHEAIVRLLLDKGCAPDVRTRDSGWTPLMLAALNGSLGVVKILLAQGANADLGAGDLTALDVAAMRGHGAIETLLQQRTNVTSRTALAKSLQADMFGAAKSGDYAIIKKLLDGPGENADVNRSDSDGATCLMFAAMRGHKAVVELLVERGAHIDAQDGVSGWTALMQATYYGHRAVVRWLIDRGANVNIQAKNGCTAFDIASIIGDTEVVRLLAAVSMRSTNGRIRPDPSTLAPPLSEKSDTDATLRRPDSGGVTLQPLRLEAIVPDPSRETWWNRIANRFWRLKSASQATPLPPLKSKQYPLSPEGPPVPPIGSAMRLPTAAATKPRLPHPPPIEPTPRRRASLSSADGDPLRKSSSNMGAPISRLPEDILAPIKPPFLPPPAFELSHIERPKLTNPVRSLSDLRRPPPRGDRLSWAAAARPLRSTTSNAYSLQRQATIDSTTSDSASEESPHDSLSALLVKNNLSKHVAKLEEQEVDLETFMTLSDADLQEMGFGDEARRELLDLIADATDRRQRAILQEGSDPFDESKSSASLHSASFESHKSSPATPRRPQPPSTPRPASARSGGARPSSARSADWAPSRVAGTRA